MSLNVAVRNCMSLSVKTLLGGSGGGILPGGDPGNPRQTIQSSFGGVPMPMADLGGYGGYAGFPGRLLGNEVEDEDEDGNEDSGGDGDSGARGGGRA